MYKSTTTPTIGKIQTIGRYYPEDTSSSDLLPHQRRLLRYCIKTERECSPGKTNFSILCDPVKTGRRRVVVEVIARDIANKKDCLVKTLVLVPNELVAVIWIKQIKKAGLQYTIFIDKKEYIHDTDIPILICTYDKLNTVLTNRTEDDLGEFPVTWSRIVYDNPQKTEKLSSSISARFSWIIINNPVYYPLITNGNNSIKETILDRNRFDHLKVRSIIDYDVGNIDKVIYYINTPVSLEYIRIILQLHELLPVNEITFSQNIGMNIVSRSELSDLLPLTGIHITEYLESILDTTVQIKSQCAICLSVPPGAIIITNCGHFLCMGCFVSYLNARLLDTRVENIQCPVCRTSIDTTASYYIKDDDKAETIINKTISNVLSQIRKTALSMLVIYRHDLSDQVHEWHKCQKIKVLNISNIPKQQTGNPFTSDTVLLLSINDPFPDMDLSHITDIILISSFIVIESIIHNIYGCSIPAGTKVHEIRVDI